MIKVSYLENFTGYMWNNDTKKHRELQNELSQTKFNKSQGRTPYSVSVIQYFLY